MILGGIYQNAEYRPADQFIQQVHFSKAFIGIDGWQAETGFTGRDMMRADVVVLESTVAIHSATACVQRVHPIPRSRRRLTALLPTIACRPPAATSTHGLTVDIVPYV